VANRFTRTIRHLLSGRVIQLEFARPADSILDAGISPKATDGVGNVARKCISLELNGEAENDSPSRIVLGCEFDFKGGHGLEDGPHRLDGIRVDNLLVRLSFLFIVASVMNELHLLEDRRLWGKASMEMFQTTTHEQRLTLPDSPAPSKSILISFLA
jgi:hypothetical protein